MPHRSPLVATCWLITALTACGDSLGPAPHTGYYLLTDANGQPPPILVGATPTCDQYLSRTTLDLVGDGTFGFVSLITSDCSRSGSSTNTSIVTWTGTYQGSDGRLILTPATAGSPRIAGNYDATQLRATIPASPQTFPIALSIRFTFVGAPPP
jgi:hypothetical protein